METMNEYYERLDSWFEMFDSSRHLKISEAKDIALKIKDSSSDLEKEKLQEELLSGTIHEVYKFIKDNGLLVLCNTGYVEFDDLISSLTLAWADNLDSRILEAGRYSSLFSRDYFENVAEQLGVDDLSDSLKIRGSGYLGALGTYYRDKDNGVPVSSYFDYTFATGMFGVEKQKSKSVDIIEKGYQLYKDNCFVNSSNTALLGLYGMIFTSIVLREGRYGCDEYEDFTDKLIVQIDVKKDILGSRKLTDIQRRILFEKYGFDGMGEKDFAEMTDNYGVGRCRIGQIAGKGLRNLRSDAKVRKYNKN